MGEHPCLQGRSDLSRLRYRCFGDPITPVIAGDETAAMELSDRLFEAGIFVQGITFPTVPQGSARVRAMVMATHTREDLGYALEAFERVGKEMDLIP